MSYRFLGSHPYEDENGKGFIFRVWAPNARMVSVMGDFNDWDGNSCQMFKLGNTGIWEQKVPGAQQWDRYKYRVVGADMSDDSSILRMCDASTSMRSTLVHGAVIRTGISSHTANWP